MVGIFVDRDGIIVPVPIPGVVIIIRSHAEVPVVEPETFAISSAKVIYVSAAEPTGEAAVFPGMIDMIVRIITARIVPNPSVIVMDVRDFRVIRLIAVRTMILLSAIVLRTALLRPSVLGAALRSAIFSGPIVLCMIL
jgi:hypothetical protein